MKTLSLSILASLCVLQSGCISRRGQLANFQTGEVLRAVFTDSPGTNGKLTVTMADGEILKGNYSAIRGHDVVTFSFSSSDISAVSNSQTTYEGRTSGSVGTTPFYRRSNGSVNTDSQISWHASGVEQSRSIGGTGRAYAMLSSTTPGSKLMLEVLVSYGVLSGHGWGEARTNDGRTYQVTF